MGILQVQSKNKRICIRSDEKNINQRYLPTSKKDFIKFNIGVSTFQKSRVKICSKREKTTIKLAKGIFLD